MPRFALLLLAAAPALLVAQPRPEGAEATKPRPPSPVPHPPEAAAAILNVPGTHTAPITLPTRAQYHAGRLLGPGALAGSAFSAGIRQLRGEPEQWGGGTAGFARRYASSYAYKTAQNTFEFGLGAALRSDPRYRRSERTGFGRVRDAVLHSLQPAHLASHAGAGMLSRAWYPDGRNSVGNGFSRAGIGIGLSMARNTAREFWPEIKRLFRR